MKIKKSGGYQGECERRIEFIVKMQKKYPGVGVWSGVGWRSSLGRWEVIVKMQKSRGGWSGWGLGGVGGGWLVAGLGVGGGVGYGECEPRIEGLVKCI